MSLPRRVLWLVPAVCFGCATESSGPSGDSDVETRPAQKSASPEAGSREGMTPTIQSMVSAGRFRGELWRLNLSERLRTPVNAKVLVVDGDLLIAQDEAHQIHAIDRASGTHRWLVAMPGPMTMAVGGTPSTVAFAATDEIVAVDRKSGTRLPSTQARPRTSNHLGFFPSGRAVAVGGMAFVGRLAPFKVQSIDLAGGHDGWGYGTSSPVMDLVVYGDGPVSQVIGVTEDGLLVSLPPRGGSAKPDENWFHRMAGTSVVTPLTLVGDSIVFGAANGFLYHVDPRGGTVRWKVGCGRDLRGREATIAGGSVYQPTDNTLMAIDLATAATQWSLDGAERVITRIGDRVYAEVGDQVVVVDAKSGKELARFGMQGLEMPTVQNGGVLIASDGTNVFALE